MSSKDTTRQKLVSSMRKTKSASGNKAAETEATSNKQPKDKKPVKSDKKPDKKVVIKDKAATGTDLYQSGRRVWPD